MNTPSKFANRKVYIFGGLAVVLLAGFFWYRSASTTQAETRYALTPVTKDTIVVSVNGTGQVSGDVQLDVKPKVSSAVKQILVKVGDKVKAGTPLVELDRTDALKTVRDAAQALDQERVSTAAARLQLEKLKEPADAVTLAQAEDALAQAQRNLQTLKDAPTPYDLAQAQADVDSAAKNIKMSDDGTMPQNVRDAYDSYVSNLQSIDQTLSKSLEDADGILGIDKTVLKFGLTRMFSVMNDSAKNQAVISYRSSKDAVTAADGLVQKLKDNGESVDNIEQASSAVSSALDQTSSLLSHLADGLQATLTATDLTQSDIDGLKSTIDSDRSNVNSKQSVILNQEQAVQQAKNSYESAQLAYQKAVNSFDKVKQGTTPADLATAQEKVNEAQAQVDKLKKGADPIDLQISQNSLAQHAISMASAQSKLADATSALNDYTVVAPFDGVVATISAQVAGEASSGSAVVTMLTSQQVATISLNEVDAAKVKVGQKATVTFDAIDGLTMTGAVAEVSPLGTVSQGVVTYNIKIAFDSQDDRIKTGMSVSTAIVTQVESDVLVVPNSAVKTQGTQQYVETLDVTSSTQAGTDGLIAYKDSPRRIIVTTGVSNDSLTEILTGLKEGDQIITKTVKPSTTKAATTQSSSALRVPGIGGTGGAMRVPTGGRPD